LSRVKYEPKTAISGAPAVATPNRVTANLCLCHCLLRLLRPRIEGPDAQNAGSNGNYLPLVTVQRLPG